MQNDLGPMVEQQATGCAGASSYRQYARKHSYKHIEVLNWCSSAGDWQFIVSKDGHEWRVLSQTNNYPRPGFSHYIGNETFYGSPDEVFAEIEAMFG